MCEAAVAFICCPIFGYLVDIAPTRQFPYLLGLILLGASMGMLTVAHTVWLFIVARLIQGGATAMVAVAGLALMTDSVPFDNLGQTIGYLGSSIALGFLLGPLLGGLVYNAAGYNAVFAMAFAFIGVDLVMRVAVIEKKVARAWLSDSPGENPGEEYPQRSSETLETPTGWRNIALLGIASKPRVMISSFALLVQGILYSAFDSVRSLMVLNLNHSQKIILTLIKPTDNPRLCRRQIQLEPLRRRNGLPPLSHNSALRTILW
jgi:MFS family permease